jgi:hypothetical protein
MRSIGKEICLVLFLSLVCSGIAFAQSSRPTSQPAEKSCCPAKSEAETQPVKEGCASCESGAASRPAASQPAAKICAADCDVEKAAWPEVKFLFFDQPMEIKNKRSDVQAHGGKFSMQSTSGSYQAQGMNTGGIACKVTGIDPAGQALKGLSVWVYIPDGVAVDKASLLVDGGSKKGPQKADGTLSYAGGKPESDWAGPLNEVFAQAPKDEWFKVDFPETTVGPNKGEVLVGVLWVTSGGPGVSIYFDDFATAACCGACSK